MDALAVLVLVSAGAGASGAAKGLVLEQETVQSFRSMVGMVRQDDRQRVYLSPSGVRIESATDSAPPKFYTIFRIEPKGRVVRIEVNGFRRTYREEDLSARAAQNEALRKALEKAFERRRREGKTGSPLDALAGAAAGGSGADSSPVEVRRTEDVRTIAGRRCRRFEFLQRGNKVFEASYTEDPAPEWVRRFDVDESPSARNAALMKARRSMKGLELESTFYRPAGGRAEVRTTRIISKTISPSLFRPPAGFRKIAPPAPPTKGGAAK